MYPFVSQQCNLIGQTLAKVVMVNLICKSNTSGNDALGYLPIQEKLSKVYNKYGRHSGLTSVCGNMQVMCSRVRTGEKTKVLDVRMDRIENYTKLAEASLTGSMCNSFCARFSLDDRDDMGNWYGEMQTFNKNVKIVLDYRALVTKLADMNYGTPRNRVLDFPQSRLDGKGLETSSFFEDICVCQENNKREKRKRVEPVETVEQDTFDFMEHIMYEEAARDDKRKRLKQM